MKKLYINKAETVVDNDNQRLKVIQEFKDVI